MQTAKEIMTPIFKGIYLSKQSFYKAKKQSYSKAKVKLELEQLMRESDSNSQALLKLYSKNNKVLNPYFEEVGGFLSNLVIDFGFLKKDVIKIPYSKAVEIKESDLLLEIIQDDTLSKDVKQLKAELDSLEIELLSGISKLKPSITKTLKESSLTRVLDLGDLEKSVFQNILNLDAKYEEYNTVLTHISVLESEEKLTEYISTMLKELRLLDIGLKTKGFRLKIIG